MQSFVFPKEPPTALLSCEPTCFDACRHVKSLRRLSLSCGRFTDEGLYMLKDLTALCFLDLQGCGNITDKGLRDVEVPLSQHSLTRVEVLGCRRLTSRSSVGHTPHCRCLLTLLNAGSL